MIRFLRAFAWLRWRTMLNGVRGSRRRDLLERVSRVAQVAVPAGLFLLLAVSALGIGFLAFMGGRMAGAGSARPGAVLLAARFVLFGACTMLLLIPLGGSTRAGATRILLLPIPRRVLHLVEVLASLADPWVVLVLPGLVLFAAGLLQGGRSGAAGLAFAAACALAAVLVSLGSLASFLASWLMRNRRRGELFVLVSVLALSLLAVVPAVASDELEVRLRAAGKKGQVVEVIDESLPGWTRALPSEVYGRSVGEALGGRFEAAWIGVAVLLAEAAVLYALSSAVHRKLLGGAEGERRRRRADPAHSIGIRLPGLTAAASAVALAQFLTAVRSVRGRLVVLLPGPLIALLSMLSRRMPEAVPGGGMLGSYGYAVLGGGAVFGLYALQAFTMNQFASDRSGLTMQFLAPIRDVDLVRGKVVGCAMILGAGVTLSFFCALAVSPGGISLAWLTVLLGVAATYLWISPIAVLFSALFPRASDLSKTGSGGNPHGLAFLLGSLLVLALSIPPGVVLAVVHHGQRRPGLALALTAAWALFAALASMPLLRVASGALESRRENVALVAQGR